MNRILVALCVGLAVTHLGAQVTYERLLNANKEPQNWLTYSGAYNGWRYSRLDQINSGNASHLKLVWAHQIATSHRIETTPLVVDGVMYVSEPPSDVTALDAASGRPYWHYRRAISGTINVCCDQVNRGVAVLGDRIFIGTIDAHLVALNAKTGAVLWDVPVADRSVGYAITGAPLVIKDMVITGVSGGEYGVLGYIDAYDVKTGERRWRFYTVPGPGEKGHETWGPGDAWKLGGGPTWLTGSYDPELNLLIWGVGNPAPDWNADARPGDNLYTDSAIALDPDNGTLKWYFQFIPHDSRDWDASQIPVLVDGDWKGKPRKLIYWAHRDGFYYVLDRTTGEFLFGKQFVAQNWAKGLDAKGRPEFLPNTVPTEEGIKLRPSVQGATNWYSPSYSPLTGFFYLSVWENEGLYTKGAPKYTPGDHYAGSAPDTEIASNPGYGAIRALDPKTGELKWEYKMQTKPWSGVLTTAGNVLFGSSGGWLSRERDNAEGYFFALNADSGKELWRIDLGGTMSANPVTYTVDGKQMVTIAAGSGIFTFSLP